MIASADSLLLLLVPAWPLLLAGALGLGVERSWVWHLASMAALPALAVAAMSDTELWLPRVMLGGSLVLDASARVFLLISAVLWLAGGVLARTSLLAARSRGVAVLWLLAMAGNFGLVLAGDVLLFFAASTLAGYALYGVLRHGADGPARRAANLLVIFLVLSDLLVFELLVLLGQSATEMRFPAFRQALLDTESQGLLLGLVIVGFGIKMGILGLHFWLPSVFANARPELRPALVSFMLSAGLLATLRLLPLGQFSDAGAAEVLAWVSWAALIYAFFGGLSKTRPRATFAHAALASGGLWLGMLSTGFRQPEWWSEASGLLAIGVVQWGFAFTALLLMSDRHGDAGNDAAPADSASVLGWLAVGLLAAAPLGIAGAANMEWSGLFGHSAMGVIAVLASLGLLGSSKSALAMPSAAADPRLENQYGVRARPVSVLIILAAVALVFKLIEASLWDVVLALLILVAAALAATGLNRINLAARMARIPRRDAVAWIAGRLASGQEVGRNLHEIGMRRWVALRQAGLWRAARLRASDLARRLEWQMSTWSTGLLLMLVVGLLAAWMGSL